MTNIAQRAASAVETLQVNPQPPRPFVWNDDLDETEEKSAQEKDHPTSACIADRFQNWGSD